MIGAPPTLRRGDTGDEVAHLQRILDVEPDGDFGPVTEMAVKMRQTALDLDVDGVAGPKTWAALIASLDFSPPDVSGLSAGEARARVAESQLGAKEATQNRGPQVDRYVEESGGHPEGKPPWCAYFVSWCGQIVQDVLGHGSIVRVRTGAARLHWQRSPAASHIERDELARKVSSANAKSWSGDELNRALRGAVYVRARSKTPHKRAAILQGARSQGHCGIVVGAHVDRLGRIIIDGVAGNSSGSGHSRVRGTGGVARERIVEGSKAWRALVGVVLP
jgi:peptidoglycan hydrolase-like protein with peptidoglycan-binding domain